MKKNLLISAALLAGTVLMTNSCSKPANGSTGPQGPAGPSYTGNISGHISLYNEYGDLQPSSACKSVRAILYNSSNKVVDSVNADSTGKYTISNVSTGLYTLAFRDTNYGQELHEDFQFLGSSQPLQVDGKLSHMPNFIFSVSDSMHVTKALDTLIYIYGTVSAAASQTRDLAVFVGATSSVSSTPGTYNSLLTTVTIAAGATTFTGSVQLNNCYLAGLNPGQTAYLNVYAAALNYASTSEYEDYNTGQTIYNALGTSALPNPVKL